ncbi:MAG: hypothetical protein AAGI72_12770 [Pseudomonadota bacterium]
MSDDRPEYVQAINEYELKLKLPQAGTDFLAEATIEVCRRFFRDAHTRSFDGSVLGLHWYTRFAAALTAFVAHPQARLTGPLLHGLCEHRQSIASVFAASGYGDCSHLTAAANVLDAQGKASLSPEKIMLLVAMMPLDTLSDPMLDFALAQQPDLLAPLVFSWLGQRAVLTPQGEKNRARLLASGTLIEGANATEELLRAATRAYMHCTYAVSEQRHDIKKSINHLFSKGADALGFHAQARNYRVVERPRVVVPLEIFLATHAMFRCYAPLIESLKPYFEVIAVAPEELIDEAADALFDKVVRFPTKNALPLQDIYKKIQSLAPDIVYFPSVGMSILTIHLSNMRLAPLQIASLGHPATTMSREIDVIYAAPIEAPEPTHDALFSEIQLESAQAHVFTPHATLPRDFQRDPPDARTRCRVAVNGKLFKLNADFLGALGLMAKRAARDIEFHFFPSETGLNADGARSMLQQQFPDATVWTNTPYLEYLRNLEQCELALAPYPFGNSNGTVDACLLGVPTVALYQGLPSQEDRWILATAEFPEYLVATSAEQYLEIALRLIDNPGESRGIRESISFESVRSRVIADEQEPGDYFGRAIDHVYRNFSQIRDGGTRVVRQSDIPVSP